MKLKVEVDLDLDNFLEEVEDYDGNVTYNLRDNEEVTEDLCEAIKREIRDTVVRRVTYRSETDTAAYIKEVLAENKDLIISKVIDKVSASITRTVKIREFTKSLDQGE